MFTILKYKYHNEDSKNTKQTLLTEGILFTVDVHNPGFLVQIIP